MRMYAMGGSLEQDEPLSGGNNNGKNRSDCVRRCYCICCLDNMDRFFMQGEGCEVGQEFRSAHRMRRRECHSEENCHIESGVSSF